MYETTKNTPSGTVPDGVIFWYEQIYKPGSVLDSHLSTLYVSTQFKPPLRLSGQHNISYTVLHQVGFTRRVDYPTRGELLPRLFTLTQNLGGNFLLTWGRVDTGTCHFVTLGIIQKGG